MLRRIIKQLTFLSALALVLSPTVSAAPITIGEALATALENHPETRQAWWNAKRAATTVKIAESAYYPTLNFAADIIHGEDFKFIEGPEVNYTTVRADFVLCMMLYDFGRTSSNVQATRMALIATNWQTDWILQRVMIRVLDNAYATLHAQATLQAALTSLEDSIKMLYAAKELNRVGLRPITDVYTSQATASQLEMDVAQLKAQLDIHRGKLATSIGYSADTPVDLIDIDELPPLPDQAVSALITFAYRQRADLQAKQARIAEAIANQARVRAGYRPSLSVRSRGGTQHTLNDRTNAGTYDVLLNFDMPLFNGFQTTYQLQQACADTQMTLQEKAQMELDISLEVLSQSRTLQACQEMLAPASDNLFNTDRAYQGVLEKYRAGKEGITEVSNALRQLAAARTRQSDVRTRYLMAIANLAYASGTLDPYTETPCD